MLKSDGRSAIAATDRAPGIVHEDGSTPASTTRTTICGATSTTVAMTTRHPTAASQRGELPKDRRFLLARCDRSHNVRPDRRRSDRVIQKAPQRVRVRLSPSWTAGTSSVSHWSSYPTAPPALAPPPLRARAGAAMARSKTERNPSHRTSDMAVVLSSVHDERPAGAGLLLVGRGGGPGVCATRGQPDMRGLGTAGPGFVFRARRLATGVTDLGWVGCP
jgi:hypothetical protein